ncbi:MAG: hypothetical protein L0Z63_11185 [Actinobacteria bacterium]|nr:hypothetical protein [Actinomycetota bacterium]
MSTITRADEKKIRDYLRGRHIPAGLGTRKEACSVAAINLALTGELTARIPDWMSPVVGRFILGVQDDMPDKMRNSPRWRRLLPLAAGTGRDPEGRTGAADPNPRMAQPCHPPRPDPTG